MPVYSTKRCGCLLQQYLLRILLQFCASERMILPAYTTVQKTSIGKAITAEENRLVDLLHTHLTFQDRAALAGLFEKRDGRYRLTYLQQAPKDLGHSQLSQERDRGAELLPFYELATRILPCLAISHGVVLQLFTDDQIPPELPFTTLQERAFALLERERLIHTATYMTTGVGCDETACFWQAIDTMARRFKGRLRPLLSGVRLTGSQGQSALMEAVAFLQDLFARDRSLSQVHAHTIPTRCIPVHLKRYLYTRSVEGSPQLLRDRYEFLVYQLLRAALEAGDVFCRQSVRFRSIEDDLIPSAEWNERKAEYLAETQLPIFQQPITEHLTMLEQDLEAQFARVNGRIAAGDNLAVQVTQRGTTRRWTLQTPTVRDPINHALFERLPRSRSMMCWPWSIRAAHSWTPLNMCWAATAIRRGMIAFSVRV